MKKVDRDWLVYFGACDEDREVFEQIFPDEGVEPTYENIVTAHSYGIDIFWFFTIMKRIAADHRMRNWCSRVESVAYGRRNEPNGWERYDRVLCRVTARLARSVFG